MSNEDIVDSVRKLLLKPPPPFCQRFNIEVGRGEAEKRFMNRVYNQIFSNFFHAQIDDVILDKRILWQVADSLGRTYVRGKTFVYYVEDDYHLHLQALEVAYGVLPEKFQKKKLSALIKYVISISEVDLEIIWEDGYFNRTGAKLLDSALVNEPMQWLSDPKYNNVLKPFQKGLQHYMEATKKPELLADTVTDMYEALEALAKVITDKPNSDLSANRERFIQQLGLNDYYKKMLREYVLYANEYRHAPAPGKDRPIPSSKEVEAFVYTTGLFIRLAISE